MRYTFNIIGAGKLGKALSALLIQHEIGTIQGICNANVDSAAEARDFLGQGQICRTPEELPPADIFCITTPDSHIEAICETLCSSERLKPGNIVMHSSGALASTVLT